LANEQLKHALRNAGLEIEDLAQRVGVDAKTAGRWLSGRTPYPRHRFRVADALAVSEHQLWPDPVDESAGSLASPGELRSHDPGYPGGTVAGDWTELLAAATSRIDLLDYTLLEVLATPGTLDDLAGKAAAGCQIRILVASPHSTAVRDADLEVAIQAGWTRDKADGADPDPIIRNQALAGQELLSQIAALPGIEVRAYIAHRYNSVLRFDDQMLVLLHLSGVGTVDAPRIRCWDGGEDGLFDRFTNHFDAIWNHAYEFTPLTAADELDEPEPEPDTVLTEREYRHQLTLVQEQFESELSLTRTYYEEEVADLDHRREQGRQLEELQTRRDAGVHSEQSDHDSE
jgi:transcriptional regulator with XRE-family HTH domain